MFSFENMGDMNFFNLRTPKDLAIIDGTGFTLDVGHANLEPVPARNFLKRSSATCTSTIITGNGTPIVPLEKGKLIFAPVMTAMRRKHATAVIEVKRFDGAVASLRALEGM